MTTITPTVAVDLAWAAGFFDGEGNVGHTHRRTRRGTAHHYVQIQMAQTERERLDHWIDIVGFGVVGGPYLPSNANARPYYVARAGRFEVVQAIAARLWPWLGPPKRAQFRDALLAYRTFVPDVALCEHGAFRQKCHPCRSAWTTKGWVNRRSTI